MKTMTVLRIVSIVVAGYLAVGHTQAAEPRDEVEKAIGKLAEQDSYRWTSVRKSAGEDEGSVKGKIRKDGLSQVVINMAGQSVEGVLLGRKGALKAEGSWKSTSEFTGSGGSPGGNPLTFLARHLSTFGKSPVVQAMGLLKQTKDLASDGAGVYSGLLTDEGVKHNVPRFGVEVSDAEGSVTFHLKDGMLVQYSYTVRAHVKFVEQKREVDYNRTTTVKIKGAGTTTLDVPREALEIIESSVTES